MQPERKLAFHSPHFPDMLGSAILSLTCCQVWPLGAMPGVQPPAAPLACTSPFTAVKHNHMSRNSHVKIIQHVIK